MSSTDQPENPTAPRKPRTGPGRGGKRAGAGNRTGKRGNRGRKGAPAINPQRFLDVEEKIGLGWDMPQIYRHFAAAWDMSEENVRQTYAQPVLDRLAKIHEEGAPTRKERMLKTLRLHYQECREQGKYRDAGDIMKLIAKIEGNLEPIRVEHTGAGGQPIAMSIGDIPADKIKARLAELIAKHAARITQTPPDNSQGAP